MPIRVPAHVVGAISGAHAQILSAVTSDPEDLRAIDLKITLLRPN